MNTAPTVTTGNTLPLIKRLFKEAGFDGLLYTCDQAKDVANGNLPGQYSAVNGIDNPAEVKKLIKANNNGNGPFYIAEWYPAWFDWWGTNTIPYQPKITPKNWMPCYLQVSPLICICFMVVPPAGL
jgi:hypothetical protein